MVNHLELSSQEFCDLRIAVYCRIKTLERYISDEEIGKKNGECYDSDLIESWKQELKRLNELEIRLNG